MQLKYVARHVRSGGRPNEEVVSVKVRCKSGSAEISTVSTTTVMGTGSGNPEKCSGNSFQTGPDQGSKTF